VTGGFWLAASVLALAAMAFVAVPLWQQRRRGGRLSLPGVIAAAAIVPAAFGLYLVTSTYDPDAASRQPVADNEVIGLIEQLAARLAMDPDDVEGWKLLGRSYRAIGDYEGARYAFEQAWNRTEAADEALKLSYAEVLLISDPTTAQGLAGDLIEDVLAGAPDSQAALWLGGIVATERRDTGLAVERFSALLASGPPPEIADVIRQQLLLLTGDAAVAGAADAAAAASNGPVIDIVVSVADSIALDAFGPNARMFLLARSADMPAPIAVKQIALNQLPGEFTLSDADAMLAGRSLGQYDSVSVVARNSGSGTPTEQPGEAFADAIVDPAAGQPVQLVIDRIVAGD
jgi:cytochrome c-type biogenesis protein CcmH